MDSATAVAVALPVAAAVPVVMTVPFALTGRAERRRHRDAAAGRYLTAGLHGDHRAWLLAAVDRPDDVRAQAELAQPLDHQAGPLADQGIGVYRGGAGRSRGNVGSPRLVLR